MEMDGYPQTKMWICGYFFMDRKKIEILKEKCFHSVEKTKKEEAISA